MSMTARDIVTTYCKRRLCGRPEYYSGRGARIGDLNSDMLQQIYQGILKEHGTAAAEQYVTMVEKIDVLSATLFLTSLYALESDQWEWKKEPKRTGPMDHIEIPADDGSDGRMLSGIFSVMEWSRGGSERDETFMIRAEFLSKHGRAQPIPRQVQDYLNEFDGEKH